MIVHTMTEKELFEEVIQDVANAVKFSDTKDQKFRRMVIKSNRFPVRAHCFYVSPRKNKWIIFLEAKTKKEIGEECRINFVTYYDSPHGVYALMLTSTSGKQHLILYPPHFFTRYMERMNLDLPRLQLIQQFFAVNNAYSYYRPNRSEVCGSTEDGIALGLMSIHGNVVFKTFISYSMCQGDQIENFTKTEKYRHEIHD